MHRVKSFKDSAIHKPKILNKVGWDSSRSLSAVPDHGIEMQSLSRAHSAQHEEKRTRMLVSMDLMFGRAGLFAFDQVHETGRYDREIGKILMRLRSKKHAVSIAIALNIQRIRRSWSPIWGKRPGQKQLEKLFLRTHFCADMRFFYCVDLRKISKSFPIAKRSYTKHIITGFCALVRQSAQGDGASTLRLASFYAIGRYGVPRKPKLALRLFALSFWQGNAESCFHLMSIEQTIFALEKVYHDMCRELGASYLFHRSAAKAEWQHQKRNIERREAMVLSRLHYCHGALRERWESERDMPALF